MNPAARPDLWDPYEVAQLGGVELVARGVVEGVLAGLHRSPFRGFSVEFAEHRPYQPGDELRYLDWEMRARADRLVVKQYEEETNLRAMIVLDASRSMDWVGGERRLTKLEYAKRLGAALAPPGVAGGAPERRDLLPPRTDGPAVWVRPAPGRHEADAPRVIAFLQPLALLGLAVAALPTVLHLLPRRVPPTVTFPAVRYLAETERQQSRRLKLRHLLLLLLRTALLASVVLAAARPVVRVGLGGAHAPTALVLVLDNSVSSGAVVEGRRVVDLLAARARAILQRVDEGDRLWLMQADGLPPAPAPAPGGPPPGRPGLDGGRGARAAAGVVASQALPGREVVVLSDLQRSAFSSGDPVTTRVLAWTPGVTPENRSLDSARPEPPVWWPSGQVVVAVGGVRRGAGGRRG